MPDWLASIIPGDVAKTVGIEWSVGESARLQSVLRAKAERHDRKFDKIQFKGEYEMKHKEAVLEALKAGPMTIEQLEEATKIKRTVLYAVTGELDRVGSIHRESIDGGRARRYSLPTNPRPFIDPRQTPPKAESYSVPTRKGTNTIPPRPWLRKENPTAPVLGMFKPGDKFMIQRGEHTLTILSTTQGLFNLTSGEPAMITPEESVQARPIVHLKAEILQSVSI